MSLIFLLGCSTEEATTKDEISKRFATAIPPRATSDQVLAYLSSQHIEHSGYLHQTKQGNVVLAAIRDESKFNLVKTDFGISFRFDDQNRLIKFDVKPQYTGP